MIQRDGSPKQDRSIGWSKSSHDLVLGGTQFRFIWNHQVIMIEDCQETRDATLLGTPFVISLCPRGQFHHVVMQAIWNHGKSWCWRSKDSFGQGLTGRCQKRNAQVEKKGMMLSSFNESPFSGFGHHFTMNFVPSLGWNFQYIYIYPSYILHVQQKSCDDVSPVRTPGSTTALLSLVDRSVDGNGQLFDIFVTWDTFSVVLFSPSDDFPLVYIFFLQDSSFDAAWPGGSGFGEFYARLFGWPFTPNEAQGTHLTGGFGSHQHGSRAATLPGLRGWDRPEDGTWGENGDRELKGKMRPKNGGSLNLDSWIVSPYGVWICFMESESWIWPQVSAFSWHLNASLEPLRLEINFPYYALMSSEFFRGLAHFYA